ncbi:MAG: vitamin B12-dependent ribonucleotide reductase [Bacillota bacterium]|nr:vitamin B12-dependent ribonucleotide reductase [Bacillota bacterium]
MRISDNARTVLERRYLRREGDRTVETPEEMLRRVADNIAAVEGQYYGADPVSVREWSDRFYELMDSLDFLPNSPTLMNAGRELQQLAACFVLPIGDAMESIFDTLKHAALIHKSGGGTGFSFSRLRPKNDQVRSTGGVASGPVSFLKVFNAATEAVKQGGTRRGANMGILRVDHPDILEFIQCKVKNADITNFNISVGLTESFMQAVRDNACYPLRNPRDGRTTGELRAREVFDLIIDHAWRNGEPGIIFLDRLNRDNPTPSLGEIESTNPCGEQPLLPYEACNLGSVNLARMVRDGAGGPEVDWERLGEVVRLSVRFLDDVIDACVYPLETITAMVKLNRKIGLGVMGFADLLIALGVSYDSPEAVDLAGRLMQAIQDQSRRASQQLAGERGTFPNFAASVYADGPPLRNATTTTIAPTGTISLIAGVSSGIEPLFAVSFVRNVLGGTRLVEVHPPFRAVAETRGFYSPALMERIAAAGSIAHIDEAPPDVRRLFVTAHDISPEWHIRIQAVFQRFTDNAVSKTVNFPRDASREDVSGAYWLAFELGCKGITIYRDGSREDQVLQVQGETTAGGRAEIPVDHIDAHGDADLIRALGGSGGPAAGRPGEAARAAGTGARGAGDGMATRADAGSRGRDRAASAAQPSARHLPAAAARGQSAALGELDAGRVETAAGLAVISDGAQLSSASAGGQARPGGIRPRPRFEESETAGMTKKFRIGGCGKLFVTVNADHQGICEVFTNTGEEGCPSLSAALSRVISIALRSGIATDAIIDQLKGIRCIGCIIDRDTRVLSCPDAIGKAIEKFLNGRNRFDLNPASGPRTVLSCPEPGCGGLMVPDSGCYTCTLCGFSKCG